MIKLGDKVKDSVSGFEGIAVSRHSYLQGCDRISIQPPIDKDGKLPDSATFDEGQVAIIELQVVSPDPFTDSISKEEAGVIGLNDVLSIDTTVHTEYIFLSHSQSITRPTGLISVKIELIGHENPDLVGYRVGDNLSVSYMDHIFHGQLVSISALATKFGAMQIEIYGTCGIA